MKTPCRDCRKARCGSMVITSTFNPVNLHQSVSGYTSKHLDSNDYWRLP
jgi:hypothetical protein